MAKVKELVSELGRDTGLLVRQEIELAKVELKEYASRVSKSGAGIGAGAAIAHMGVVTILAAIVLALISAGVAPWLAAAVVGVVALVVGYLLIQGARRRLTATPSPFPRTAQATKETVQWAKEQLQ